MLQRSVCTHNSIVAHDDFVQSKRACKAAFHCRPTKRRFAIIEKNVIVFTPCVINVTNVPIMMQAHAKVGGWCMNKRKE